MKPDYAAISTRLLLCSFLTVGAYWAISLVRPDLFVVAIHNPQVAQVLKIMSDYPAIGALVYIPLSFGVSVVTVIISADVQRLDMKLLLLVVTLVVVGTPVKMVAPEFGLAFDISRVFVAILATRHSPWVSAARFAAISLMAICYQYATFQTRSVPLSAITTDNTSAGLILSLDYYALYGILMSRHMLGGESHELLGRLVPERAKDGKADFHAKGARGTNRETGGRTRRNQPKNRRGRTGRLTVKFRIWAEFHREALIIYPVVFICMIINAYLAGRLIELIPFFIGYRAIRDMFPETYHSDPWKQCLVVSAIMFSVTMWLLPPLRVTLVGASILSWVVGYALWRESLYRRPRGDVVANAQEKAVEDVRAACRRAGLSRMMEDTAVGFMVYRLSVKEQVEREPGTTIESITQRRKRIKRALSRFCPVVKDPSS